MKKNGIMIAVLCRVMGLLGGHETPGWRCGSQGDSWRGAGIDSRRRLSCVELI